MEINFNTVNTVDIYTHTSIYTHICVTLEEFEAEFFPLKYNPTTSE